MGRVKELLFDELDQEAILDRANALAEFRRAKAEEAEARLVQEREWVGRHPAEWGEWLRLQPLLFLPITFGDTERFDFPQFLLEVGPRPFSNGTVQQKDVTLPYRPGNLVWVKERRSKVEARPVESPYLTVAEAAAYCRRSPKTVLNHHSLCDIRSMPGTRPPLFRREDLDQWLSARRKSRRA
ncbi:unnamed protein product [Gemmata massiliana]|uniref:Helix-turn-helix domain-containing protein n=1 Tax=Gemmata massiliana TaxID=1210884 RepID=A0A6P2CWI0_9BACT|nr:helix-turn-helix domain-containing protein [Gemmata massiliana]VTR93341.1 unnamed protein product [Gemmata massiliana]